MVSMRRKFFKWLYQRFDSIEWRLTIALWYGIIELGGFQAAISEVSRETKIILKGVRDARR